MKTHWKPILAALTIVSAVGGSFVIAQAATTETTSAPPAGTAHPSHQPHMDISILRLREARNQLDLARPDKGGYREKAIASVDQAIKDVQAGIDYAEAHPEEFADAARGPRGTGPRGTAARGTGTGG